MPKPDTGRNIFLSMIITLLVAGCGVKTDPIPRSRISVPPPSNISPTITEDGVTFTNPRADSTLVIERARSVNGQCDGRLAEIARVAPNASFTDTPESCGDLVYRLVAEDIRSGVSSDSATIRIDIDNPPAVLAAEALLGPADEIIVNITLNEAADYVDVVSGGKRVMRTSKPSFTPAGDITESITLVPRTESGVRGEGITLTLPSMTARPAMPVDGRAVKRPGEILLTWRAGRTARSFSIDVMENGRVRHLATVSATIHIITGELAEGCPVFTVTALNEDGGRSRPLIIPSCP